MGKYFKISCLFILTVLLYGCDEYKGEQTMPSYIRVKGFKVVANQDLNSQYVQKDGFLSSDIPDVCVYVTSGNEQKSLGAYSFAKDSSGVVVPILEKGKHLIELHPGIKYNGMASTREYYQFYTYWQDTVDLQEGKIVDIDTMTVMYNSYAVMNNVYMFEDNFCPFSADTYIDSNIQGPDMQIISGDSVAYGNRCGAFYSNSSADDYKIISLDSVVCSNHNAMILEMDYHSNISFNIGLYGSVSAESKSYYIPCMRIYANDNPVYLPSDKRNWKKMYIILGKVWQQLEYRPFKIWLQPVNDKNQKNGFVHIDNIKIVHFPESI